MGPVAARCELELYGRERSPRVSGIEGGVVFHGHLSVDGNYVGVGIVPDKAVAVGESATAMVLCPFEADYTSIVCGAELDVVEGPDVIGRVLFSETWIRALEIRHESHSLGVCPVNLADAGMCVWSGPFLPWAGYERVRAIFRKFGEVSDQAGKPAERARREYYAARDALGLTALEWPSGNEAEVEWIQIWDLGDLANLMADVHGWQPA